MKQRALHRDRESRAVAAALIVVVTAGAWLRLSDANWDQGFHLHPDERYMSTVASAAQWPLSVGEYFDVDRSPLSPYNTDEGRSYSYGTLPLFGTKLVAATVGKDDYDHLYLVGRGLSAIADTLTIVLVFLIARALLASSSRWVRDVGALLAAAFYAFAVAAVQSAHFFTTDSWLVLFGTVTVYVALRSVGTARAHGAADLTALVLIGAAAGLTVACKISGVFVALPIIVALLWRVAVMNEQRGRAAAAVGATRDTLVILVGAYLAFRLVSPYAFAHSNWLQLAPGADYRAAVDEQRDILDGKVLYPPTFQWLLSPRLLDPLRNLVVWQLGLPLGISAVAGVALLAKRLLRPSISGPREVEFVGTAMLLAFVVAVFLYMGSRFQHMGRYLLPIIPLLGVAAAGALAILSGRNARVLALAGALIAAATAAYAVSFHHVYGSKNTRVAASEWILRNVATGATVASEAWDDALPVGSPPGRYRTLQVPVFDPDDSEKLGKLYRSLRSADYYVLSSPRAWKTIGRLPDRFPLMSRFYRQLFDQRLGFERVASFSSEPKLFGLQLDDGGAEEAFWVYDHAPVLILRRRGTLQRAALERALCRRPAPAACAGARSR